MFSERFSDDESEIPVLHADMVIDMRRSVADFGGFVCTPTNRSGAPIQSLKMIDGKLYIGKGFEGEINLLYRRTPKRVYADMPNEEIDISAEYTALLPLLCAYYVLLERDNSHCEYYKTLYGDLLRALKNQSYEHLDGQYIDTRGWS